MNTRALTSSAIAGLLRPMLADINVVSAPSVAKERGIVIEETTSEADSDYDALVTLTVITEKVERTVSGTVFADGKPRIVEIKGIKVDAGFAPSMIYVANEDKPGFVGSFASLLGEAGVNIATFALGRLSQGGDAIALVQIDGDVSETVMDKVRKLPQVRMAKPLVF
jgi:D-3-phosphoglycerate dehydrogenase